MVDGFEPVRLFTFLQRGLVQFVLDPGFDEYGYDSYFWICNFQGMDWEPILWIGGSFLAVISGLLTWIAVLLRADRTIIIVRLDKYEAWIMSQQKEINDLTHSTNTAIELIKVEQAHAQDRLKIFQENFFNMKKKRQ